jgi:hypothetical protein
MRPLKPIANHLGKHRSIFRHQKSKIVSSISDTFWLLNSGENNDLFSTPFCVRLTFHLSASGRARGLPRTMRSGARYDCTRKIIRNWHLAAVLTRRRRRLRPDCRLRVSDGCGSCTATRRSRACGRG